MRSYVVMVLLVAMAGLFVVLQVTREPAAHEITVAAPTAKTIPAGPGRETPGKAKSKPGETPRPREKIVKRPVRGGTPDHAKPRAKRRAKAKPPRPLLKRPLRVVSMGWELMAPGVVANAGAKPGKQSLFKKNNLTVHFAGYRSMASIEAALARGGEEEKGADVAIVPLPSLVASFERLRALKPQVFFVVGWSRGRDGLVVGPKASLRRPPRGTVNLVGEPGNPATFFSLFMMDLAGIPLSKVRLLKREAVRSGSSRPSYVYIVGKRTIRLRSVSKPKIPFRTGTRPLARGSLPEGGKFLVTTADVPRLIPMVAVAPEGFIKAHGKALTVWGQVWMEGIQRMQDDVPGTARRLAKLKGAPHALDLLKRLGQLAPATLVDNARLVRLSGRDAVTLDVLFSHCWRIWRAVGVLSSPRPEITPLSVVTLSSVVRTFPSEVESIPAPAGGGGKSAGKPSAEFRSLLVHHPAIKRWDQRTATGSVGFLGALFHYSKLQVSVRGSLGRGRGVVKSALSRFDLEKPERVTARGRKDGKLLAIEVLTLQ